MGGANATADTDPAAPLRAALGTLARGDAREGAEALLRIAAPRLAARLGDADHLAHLLGNAAWGPLAGHRAAEIENLERIDDAARATVRVDAADGVTVRYVASLRRGADGWRLTGLVREELADL